jgi:acyl-CoA thioester hydrolase
MTRKILIIDDDQTLVAPLKDGLESMGYSVAVAYDGLQGILQAHQSKPEVIILDFHMPGGGGRTVYERLRQKADTKDTPIIFSTVVSMDEVKGQISPSAHTYFLRKPVGLNQIVAALNSILGDDKPVPPAPSVPVIPPLTTSSGALLPASAGISHPPRHRRTVRPHKKTPKFHEFQVRVTYADTDKLGIIYYSNYFKYFEEGRTELMRSLGVRYRDLELQRKIYLPAVETGCRYLSPSRYDDLLVVRTWLSSMGIASVRFENEIYDRESGGRKVARGFSRHAVVNDLWRTTRIPDDLRLLLEPYVGLLPGS